MNISGFSTVVLASASPRREELFSLLGLDFKIMPADVEETPYPDESAAVYVVRLAEQKAKWVSLQVAESSLIIAADTTVVFNEEILGKPSNKNEAENMLRSLRGKTHQVYSGIAVFLYGLLVKDLCRTDVPMREYSDQEIVSYIESGDPFDKAGSYAIQHAQFHPVENLHGCYANVMGLPLCHLSRSFRRMRIPIHDQIPEVCQDHIGYNCPVYQSIL